jgi:hypothetical protein
VPFVVYRGEKRIADIVRRNFGELNAGERKRARDVLLRANPQLGDLDKVVDGSLLVLPAELGRRVAADDAREPPAAAAAEALADELRDLLDRLEAASEADRTATKQLEELVNDGELQDIVNTVDQGERLELVRRSIEDKQIRADERERFLEQAHQGFEHLENLRGRFGI